MIASRNMSDAKGSLVTLLQNMPKGYGEGKLMSDNDAKRIASRVTENFFLVPSADIPSLGVSEDTLTAEAAPVYFPARVELDRLDDDETWWESIIATIANYQALLFIQHLDKEQTKQHAKDAEFAFTLFKVSDPAKLHYTSWEHVSQLDQQRWLNVARKAREELKDAK